MPVRKRGDRWHVRLQVGGQRYEQSLGPSASKADALAYEGKIRADIVAGRLGSEPEHNLDDALLRRWHTNYPDFLGSSKSTRPA